MDKDCTSKFCPIVCRCGARGNQEMHNSVGLAAALGRDFADMPEYVCDACTRKEAGEIAGGVATKESIREFFQREVAEGRTFKAKIEEMEALKNAFEVGSSQVSLNNLHEVN